MLVTCAVPVATRVLAQGAVVIPRVQGQVRVDGRVDEPAWDAIEPLRAMTSWPTAGLQPSEPTEFRVAHDAEFIYFSCRNYDSDVDGIRVLSLRRDEGSLSNDWCVLSLDTYFDRETLAVFGITAAGQRTDVVFSNDGASGNFTWNTFWDAAATRDEHGWYAEGRVPLSSIRFAESDDRVTMGLLIWRSIGRKNEVITYPEISDRWGLFGVVKASLAAPVELRGLSRRTPVYVTPYGLGGHGRQQSVNDAGTAYVPDDQVVRDVGLDVKYGLTENLTLDLTVNTDFAQVEADDQQVNLTRFSLFFPERRLFFQERASLFNVDLGGGERLFYTRRIGLVGGEPVPIYGGARVVGRIGGWDVGLLDMHTDAGAAVRSENFGVFRLRRQVVNDNSYVGGLLTTRLGEDGSYNVTYGVDGIARLFGQDYLTVNWAQTFDDGEGQVRGGLGRGVARLRWERRGQDGISYAFEGARVGAKFMPEMGFLRRQDITRASADVFHGWRYQERTILRQQLGFASSVFLRNSDRRVETAEFVPQWRIETQTGHTIAITGTSTYDQLQSGFSLSDDAGVPAGAYTFHSVGASYQPADVMLFRPSVAVSGGTYYDGWRLSVSAGAVWSMSRHVQLNMNYGLNRIHFSDRGEQFTSHLVRLRVQAAFGRALIATAFVQYNNAAGVVVSNLRVRYNPREGIDLYVVYNEGRNTDRLSSDPILPTLQNRTLLIKYSHTLRFEF